MSPATAYAHSLVVNEDKSVENDDESPSDTVPGTAGQYQDRVKQVSGHGARVGTFRQVPGHSTMAEVVRTW